MSDLITDAMVEAAARTEWTHERHIRPWEKAPDDLAGHCRGCSRAALEAAAPAIAAKALRDAADELRRLDDGRTGGYYEAGRGIIQRLAARADRIERAES